MKPDIGMLKDPGHLLALGFGSGLVPVAPGTFGTLAAVPIYLLVLSLNLPLIGYLLLILAGSLLGIRICGRTARQLGVHDHPAIVWDEVMGYLLTMTAAPPGWAWVVAGFVAFRVLDILKPWPIGLIDRRLQGGTGIIMDDLLAGLGACLVIQFVALLINYTGLVQV